MEEWYANIKVKSPTAEYQLCLTPVSAARVSWAAPFLMQRCARPSVSDDPFVIMSYLIGVLYLLAAEGGGGGEEGGGRAGRGGGGAGWSHESLESE